MELASQSNKNESFHVGVTEQSGGRVHKTGLGQGSRGSSSFKDNVLITKGLEQNEQAW